MNILQPWPPHLFRKNCYPGLNRAEDFTETDLQAIRASEPPPDANETAIQQEPPGNGYCLGLVRFRRARHPPGAAAGGRTESRERFIRLC